MALRYIERKIRDRGGAIVGGPGWQVDVWNDQAMTVHTAVKLDSAGAFARDNPGFGNSGWQYLLTAQLLPAGTTLQLESTSGIVKGDVFQVVDGLFVAFLTVKSVDSGVQITVVSAPGGAHTFAVGSTAGDPDNLGDWAGWIDDAADVFVTVTKVGSTVPSVPKQWHIKQTLATTVYLEEGSQVGIRGKLNFIGGTITAADDVANDRVNVTVAAGPDNASYVTTATESGLSNEKVLGTAVIMRGTIAARPAGSLDGRIYVSTDETPPTLYRDNGAAWEAYGFRDPLTTRGDIIVRTAAGTTRLALGASGTVPRSDGTDLLYVALAVENIAGLVRVVKTADETVNNSATLQNDDHLSFGIGANEKWAAILMLDVEDTGVGAGTSGYKFAFTVPAGTTGKGSVDVHPNTDTPSRIADLTAATSKWTGSSSFQAVLLLHCVFISAGTAGTVQLQWAQNTAVAENTKTYAGSWLIAWRLS